MAKSTASDPRFARRARPWHNRVTAFFNAAQGGIPIARALPRRIDCEAFVLTFLKPEAAFGEGLGEGEPARVSLKPEDFKVGELASARAGHPSISLGLSNWIYHLPRWHTSRILPVSHPPYAVVTAEWQLEHVKHDIRLVPGDTHMLEDYLRHDYMSYLESEGGPNWRVREEACKGDTLGGDPLPSYRVDDFLENNLRSPPQDYEAVTSNALHWLRYFWAPRPALQDTLIYTVAVAPDVLLTASFHVTRMNSESDQGWWDLFLEDCETLVRTIACQRRALPNTD